MSEWTLGAKRGDWLRRMRCRITGHRWDWNARGNQALCPRCWTVRDV